MLASYCFLEGHCDNMDVNDNTTVAQGEEMCDKKYGNAAWTAMGLDNWEFNTMTRHTPLTTRDQSRTYGKMSCAMGIFHCDVMACKAKYCTSKRSIRHFSSLRNSDPYSP